MRELAPAEKLVMLWLGEGADTEGNHAYNDVDDIAQNTGLPVPHVVQILKNLHDRGLVSPMEGYDNQLSFDLTQLDPAA